MYTVGTISNGHKKTNAAVTEIYFVLGKWIAKEENNKVLLGIRMEGSMSS